MSLIRSAPEELDLHDELFRGDFQRIYTGKIESLRCDLELNPLRAVKLKELETPVLVSGFRRYYAAREAGLTTFPVLVMETARIHPLEIMLMSMDAASHLPLEIADALGRVSRLLAMNPNRLMNRFRHLSNHPERRVIAQISHLKSPVIRRMYREGVDIKKVSVLSQLEPTFRAAAVVFSSRFTKLSVSRLRRMLELVRDVSLRTHEPPGTILRRFRRKTLTNETGDRNPELILEMMHRERAPMQSGLSEMFKKLSEELYLPNNVSLSHAPFFEGDDLTIQATFRSVNELKEIINSIDPDKATWQALLRLLNPESGKES